jgi:hypothetical protein
MGSAIYLEGVDKKLFVDHLFAKLFAAQCSLTHLTHFPVAFRVGFSQVAGGFHFAHVLCCLVNESSDFKQQHGADWAVVSRKPKRPPTKPPSIRQYVHRFCAV